MGAQPAGCILPERGFVVADWRAREALDFIELGLLLRRVVGRRRVGPEFRLRGQDPRLPGCGRRQDWVRAVPFARLVRYCAGPFRVGAVRFTALDDEGGDLLAERKAGVGVARIVDAGDDPRACGLRGLIAEELRA